MHKLTAQPVDVDVSLDEAVRAVSLQPLSAILESTDTRTNQGRFTILCCQPVEVIDCPPDGPDPFEQMREALRRTQLTPPGDCELPSHLPFFGGWVGFFSYEAGRFIERLPATTNRDLPIPLARFALYESALIHDAKDSQWWEVRSPQSNPTNWLKEPRASARADQTRLKLPSPSTNLTPDIYLNRVRRAKRYIEAGDIFQVNLTRRESFPITEPASTIYDRLRRANPAAYAAYLAWTNPAGDPIAILSASPELFLKVDGQEVRTRPIKGTRPRSADPIVDAARIADLAVSDKDRAELAMIVDLERNDLGRVCEYGSVRVETADTQATPYRIETHPTVHHLVADVTGRLRPECDVIDLLRATFPGGSITGAPNVRAIQIIDELETTERVVYTGAIGYFSLDGHASFNIAIRTMTITAGHAHIGTGGGIVADSDPEEEFEETQVKIAGLRTALGVGDPSHREVPHPK